MIRIENVTGPGVHPGETIIPLFDYLTRTFAWQSLLHEN